MLSSLSRNSPLSYHRRSSFLSVFTLEHVGHGDGVICSSLRSGASYSPCSSDEVISVEWCCSSEILFMNAPTHSNAVKESASPIVYSHMRRPQLSFLFLTALILHTLSNGNNAIAAGTYRRRPVLGDRSLR